MIKPWYKSRTLWLGAAAVLAAGASALASPDAGWREIVLACVGAAVVFIRTQTGEGLSK
jgi:predicted Zn-dependent protease